MTKCEKEILTHACTILRKRQELVEDMNDPLYGMIDEAVYLMMDFIDS